MKPTLSRSRRFLRSIVLWLDGEIAERQRRRARRCLLRLEELEPRWVPVTDFFTNPNGGDWDTAGNWSNGVPTVNDDAVIGSASFAVTGPVTHSVANSDSVASVSCSAPFTMSAGSLNIVGAGQFSNSFTL
jgi:hypothetical protein